MFKSRKKGRRNTAGPDRRRGRKPARSRQRKGGSILSALILECLAIGGILMLFFAVHEDPRNTTEPQVNPQAITGQESHTAAEPPAYELVDRYGQPAGVVARREVAEPVLNWRIAPLNGQGN